MTKLRKPAYSSCPHKRYNDDYNENDPNDKLVFCMLGNECMVIFDWKNCLHYKINKEEIDDGT